MQLEDVWPLFGLRVTTPRLVLRPVHDEDLPGLVEAALAGIHDPAEMPFGVPWTDADPETLRRDLAKHQWRLRTRVEPDTWAINFAVLRDGVPIGVQDVSASDFALRRTVESGSWLMRAQQGQGLGREMRAGMLLLVFDHLGAEVAESSATDWNARSLGVSRALGYVDNGVSTVPGRPGTVQREQRVRVTRESFVRPGWDIRVEGLEAARKDLLRDG